MKLHKIFTVLAFTVLSLSVSAASFDEIDLDSLQLISESEQIRIYIKPGVDLSEYKYLDVQNSQATLDKKWLDSFNRKRKSLSSKLNKRDIENMTQDYATHFDEFAQDFLTKNSDYSLEPVEGMKGLRLDMYINKLIIYQAGEKHNPRIKMISKEGEAELDTVMYDSQTGELVAVLLDQKETFERVMPRRMSKSRKTEKFEPMYQVWMEDLLATLTLKAD